MALLTALLASLHPDHDATRLWLSGSIASCALLGTVLSLRLYRLWQRQGSGLRLASALGLFAATTLVYEAAAPLAALALLPTRPGENFSGRIRSCAPLWSVLLALMGYQRIIAPWLQGAERHPVSLSAIHGLKVLASGFECSLANRLSHLIWKQASFAATNFSAWDWLLFAAAACALAWLARHASRDWRPLGRSFLLVGAAWWFLGYAPYFFDRTYTPSMFDLTNRVNLTSSLGAAMILIWLLSRLRAAVASWAISALAAAFLLAGWTSNAQWAKAYALQQETLANMTRTDAPGPVLVFGVAPSVGSATIFSAGYDLDHALLLRGSRVKAYLAEGRTRFGSDAAIVAPQTRLPYAGLLAFDAASGRMIPVTNARSGQAFLADISR
jgi:hypothetical protein